MVAYWDVAAHSAYDMFYKYKYLIVNLAFSHLGFWSGDFILIVPFLIIAHSLWQAHLMHFLQETLAGKISVVNSSQLIFI